MPSGPLPTLQVSMLDIYLDSPQPLAIWCQEGEGCTVKIMTTSLWSWRSHVCPHWQRSPSTQMRRDLQGIQAYVCENHDLAPDPFTYQIAICNLPHAVGLLSHRTWTVIINKIYGMLNGSEINCVYQLVSISNSTSL